MARIQIVSSQWTPLTLYFLVRCMRRARFRDAVGAGVSFALQGLACTYYELYFAIVLVVCAPLLLLGGARHVARRRLVGRFVIAGAVAATLLAPANYAQWQRLRGLEVERAARHHATLASHTQTLPTNWLYGPILGREDVGYDDRYFPGLLPLVLTVAGAIVALRRRRSRAVRALLPIAGIGVSGFLFAFGERLPGALGGGPGPFAALLAVVPTLDGTRVPARFLMLFRAAVAVAAALGLRQLLVRTVRRRPLRWALSAALAIALPLEHLSTPLPAWGLPAAAELPPIYEALSRLREAGAPAIVEFPPQPPRLRRGEALWEYLSTYHWLRIVNAYPSYDPLHFAFVYDAILELPEPRSFELLRTLGVEYLVHHPGDPGHEEGRRALRRFERALPENEHQIELVGAWPGPPRAATPWLVLGGERLFRIKPRTWERRAHSPLSDLVEVERLDWRCESSPASLCEAALDDDPKTYFRTTIPQSTSHYFRVLFPGPIYVRGIGLQQGLWSRHYPRTPVFYGLSDDGVWRRVSHSFDAVAFLQEMLTLPEKATMEFLLPETELVGLEVRLDHPHATFRDWRLPEFRIYR